MLRVVEGIEAILDHNKTMLEHNKAMLEHNKKVDEFLLKKIIPKDASKLSKSFYDKLRIAIVPKDRIKGGLKCCSDDDFEKVLRDVTKYAETMMRLGNLKGKPLSEKHDIQPESKLLMEALMKTLLAGCQAEILQEVEYFLNITTVDNTENEIHGVADKFLHFKEIGRHLLSFEDKNWTTTDGAINSKHKAQAVTQVRYLGKEIQKIYRLPLPLVVGFVCDGISFVMIQFGLVKGEELTTESSAIQFLVREKKSNELVVDSEALEIMAMMLVHGFLCAKALYQRLREVQFDFKLEVIHEEETDGGEKKGDKDDDGSTKEKDSDDIMENINLGSLCLNPKSEGMKTRSTSNIKVS